MACSRGLDGVVVVVRFAPISGSGWSRAMSSPVLGSVMGVLPLMGLCLPPSCYDSCAHRFVTSGLRAWPMAFVASIALNTSSGVILPAS